MAISAASAGPSQLRTPASRCLVAVMSSVPFFLVFLIAHHFLLVVAGDGLHRDVVVWVQRALLFGSVSNLALAAWLWKHRESTASRPMASRFITLSIGIIFGLIQIAFGTFTSGASLILVGCLAIGLMLFSLRNMILAIAVCALGIMSYDLAVIVGKVPYAPALSIAAFNGTVPTHWWELWRSAMLYGALAVLVHLVFWLFAQIDEQRHKLEKLSQTDVLTGMSNRMYFMERLNAETRRRDRFARPFTVVMIDADHFKRINDTHGHQVGDQVLNRLAEVLGMLRRPTDVAARLGGEEFALLLPETQLQASQVLCNRVMEAVRAQRFFVDGTSLQFTVSLGVVECRQESAAEILRLADRNLYRAKNLGRNQAVYSVAGECPEESQLSEVNQAVEHMAKLSYGAGNQADAVNRPHSSREG